MNLALTPQVILKTIIHHKGKKFYGGKTKNRKLPIKLDILFLNRLNNRKAEFITQLHNFHIKKEIMPLFPHTLESEQFKSSNK